MLIRKKLPLLLVIAMMIVVAVAGCGGKDAPPPTPTRTPLPTFTPTPAGQVANADLVGVETQAPAGGTGADVLPTDTPVPPPPPTNTPEPTPEPATATPVPPSVIAKQLVNVRGGPGTSYSIMGQAQPNQKFVVTGKNPQGDWWQIDFNGQPAWIIDRLVNKDGQTDVVQVVASIPPSPTPRPRSPTATPAPTQPPAPPKPTYPYSLGKGTWSCTPNAGSTYFNGFVRDRNNNPLNGVCLHIGYYGPRKTKCSGCDGVGDGVWGFSPFGGPGTPGTPIEIYVVKCPSSTLPLGGISDPGSFGDLTPLSEKWQMTISESVQCTGITFYRN